MDFGVLHITRTQLASTNFERKQPYTMAGVPQKQPATSQRPAKPPQLKFTPNVSAPQFQRPVQPVKPVPVDITKTEAYKRAKNRY